MCGRLCIGRSTTTSDKNGHTSGDECSGSEAVDPSLHSRGGLSEGYILVTARTDCDRCLALDPTMLAQLTDVSVEESALCCGLPAA